MLHGDVVDQLLDDDRLADAGAAEQADLAAAQVRLEQVDDLDAGLEHLQLGRLLLERRRRAVDRPALLRLDRPIRESPPARRARSCTRPSVAGPTGIEIGAPMSIASMPRCMPSVGFIATVRTRFSPRCCSTSAMTSIACPPLPSRLDAERVVDLRQVPALELDVDDRSDDLDDLADLLLLLLLLPYVAQWLCDAVRRSGSLPL